VRAVPRKLIATTGVVLALALAGCGGDDKSSTTAQSAATATTPAATPTTTTSGDSKTTKTTAKAGGTKTTSKSTDAQPAKTTSKGASGSAKSGKAKTTTTKTPAPGTTTKSPAPGSAGPDLSSGTGSGPTADRQDAVTALRRYYKGFIDRDGDVVCSLLTSEGRRVMIADGKGKTCEDSVKRLIATTSPENFALLTRTRDGLHADDITVKGDTATAQIGKASALRLAQVGGRWLVSSPNVVDSRPR
jgi:hypothetical protein